MRKNTIGSDKRNIAQYKNIFQSSILKGISVASSFAVFSISLSYLSQENYGVWLTIYSIVGWTAFFDMGLGNGMKNKLIVSIAQNKIVETRKIISTGYVLMFCIVAGLILLASISYFTINWNEVLRIRNKDLNINALVYCCFILFGIKIFLDPINQLLYAHQKVAYANLINCVANVCVLITICCISKLWSIPPQHRLFIIGMIVSFVPVVVLFLYSIYLFSTKYKHLIPSISQFDKTYIKSLVSKGSQFFIIQIAALIIFSTDNIIIVQLFSPADVTIYNTAYRLFSIFTTIWGIVLMPYWAAFGEAFALSDYNWIKKKLLMLYKFWLVMQLFLLLFLFFVNNIYKIWVGNNMNVPFSLSLLMALYISLSSYCNIYAFFLNGIGKIKLQLFTSIFAAIINIPMAVFFGINLRMGLGGIILATSASLLGGAVLQTIQYRKISSFKASGIWNA